MYTVQFVHIVSCTIMYSTIQKYGPQNHILGQIFISFPINTNYIHNNWTQYGIV